MAKHKRRQAQVHNAGFSVAWTTSYPALLGLSPSPLITRSGYASCRRTKGLLFPWQVLDRAQATGPKEAPILSGRWSGFWSSYLLRKPALYWNLTDDLAWDFIVPLKRSTARFSVSNPAMRDMVAEADVLVYPSVVTVFIWVGATGVWSLAELAERFAEAGFSSAWEMTGPESSMRSSSLDAIAAEMTAYASSLFGDQRHGIPTVPTKRIVAGIFNGIESLDVSDEQVSSCLAGLAGLKAEENPAPQGFLKPNRLKSHSARIYTDEEGHVLWPDGNLSQTPRHERGLASLLQNHTELVAHIVALSEIVSWAGDQIAARTPIPIPVQPIVQRAALRLSTLYEGDRRSTYRSGISEVRIGPLLDTLDLVHRTL